MWRKWKCRIFFEKIYFVININKIVSNNVEFILIKLFRDIFKVEEVKEFLFFFRGLIFLIKSN